MSEQPPVYQTLFERLPIGLLRFDADGIIQQVNSALAALLGLPVRRALEGQSLRVYFADPSEMNHFFHELHTSGIVDDMDFQLLRMDGGSIRVRANARPVPDERGKHQFFEASIVNITQERQPDAALRESDHLVRTLIDSVGEGVLFFDTKFHCRVWNTYLEDVTGIQADEILNLDVRGFLERFQIKGVEQSLTNVLAGETVRINDIPISSKKTGRRQWFSITFSPHRSSSGQIVGAVGTWHNTTERRKAEREKEALLRKEHLQLVRAEALGRVSQALNAVLDLRSLLELICRETSELFEVDASLVWLVERLGDEESVLEKIAGYGWEHERFTGMQINLQDMNNLAARVIHEKKSLTLNEASESSHTGLSNVFNVRSIMAIPLIFQDEVLGVLQVIDTHRMNRFNDSDLETAAQLAAHTANAIHNAQLYDQLQEAHNELEQAYVSTLEGWARALELRDSHTEGHSQRVTEMALRLARVVGVPTEELEHVRRGSLLHDIGKMAIPDDILKKPGPLDAGEWKIMRQHPVYARTLLSPISFLRPAIDIPYCHHERWDGTGYPRGLAGERIPLAARVFAVVDVFEALTSDRPYRKAWKREDAIAHIKKESGSHFDPQIVEAFLRIV